MKKKSRNRYSRMITYCICPPSPFIMTPGLSCWGNRMFHFLTYSVIHLKCHLRLNEQIQLCTVHLQTKDRLWCFLHTEGAIETNLMARGSHRNRVYFNKTEGRCVESRWSHLSTTKWCMAVCRGAIRKQKSTVFSCPAFRGTEWRETSWMIPGAQSCTRVLEHITDYR